MLVAAEAAAEAAQLLLSLPFLKPFVLAEYPNNDNDDNNNTNYNHNDYNDNSKNNNYDNNNNNNSKM